MADLRITRKRVRNHFYYSWWKYLIAAVLCALAVTAGFDMTRYRPPKEKRLTFYVTCGHADAQAMEDALWPLLQARCPEQEELNVQNINLRSDDMYARMQFSTYLGAGEGDVLLLDTEEMDRLIGDDGPGEIFLDLSPYAASGVLRIDSTSEYRIPADSLTGLSAFGCDPAGAVLVVLQRSANPDTAAALIGLLQEQFGN